MMMVVMTEKPMGMGVFVVMAMFRSMFMLMLCSMIVITASIMLMSFVVWVWFWMIVGHATPEKNAVIAIPYLVLSGSARAQNHLMLRI